MEPPVPFQPARWCRLLPLNPIACKADLEAAVADGSVVFPLGISDVEVMPLIVRKLQLLDPSSESFAVLDSSVRQERQFLWQRYSQFLAPAAAASTGFPYPAVLDLLDRLAAGEHPQFAAAACNWLEDWFVDIHIHWPDEVHPIQFTGPQ